MSLNCNTREHSLVCSDACYTCTCTFTCYKQKELYIYLHIAHIAVQTFILTSETYMYTQHCITLQAMEAAKNIPLSDKVRYEKWKTEKNTRKGKLSFNYCNDVDKEEMFEKIAATKKHMGDGNPNIITTFELLHRVLDFYMLANCKDNKVLDCDYFVGGSEYQLASGKDTKSEELFISTESSLSQLISRTQAHRGCCDQPLSIKKSNRFQHAVQLNVTCDNNHTITWTSSPYVQGGKLLVNLRMAHGYLTSGILPNQYSKMCSEAKLGALGHKYVEGILPAYLETVQEVRNAGTEDALLEEIAAEEVSTKNSAEGINILTDARHCWRKNARFSDIVCIGANTHKVLFATTVSKDDDPCTQRHELIGVERMYQFFDEQCVPVKNHAHDNNASVSKYVTTERSPTQNAKDTWHATKSLAKDMKDIIRTCLPRRQGVVQRTIGQSCIH